MGSESKTLVNSVNNSSSDSGSSELVKPANGDQQMGVDEMFSAPSFVNKETLREDQVQNASKFLSHPKVRGSPVMYRRSFLERKGLTKEEIDEAFRRVPDDPSSAVNLPADVPAQGNQLKPLTGTQPHVSVPATHPLTATTGPGPVVPGIQNSKFNWSRAVLTIGFLATSTVGTAVLATNVIVPRLKAWIRKIALEDNESDKRRHVTPTLAEEAVSAAKVASVAATDIVKASHDLLNLRIDDQKRFESLMALLNVQVQEIKSMVNAIQKLETARESAASHTVKHLDDHLKSSVENGPTDDRWRYPNVQVKPNGSAHRDLQIARNSLAPVSMEPRKSFDEVVAMVQRGEKPSGIKEIDDRPPNPNQLPSNPQLLPRAKPWGEPDVDPHFRFGSQKERGGEISKLEASETWARPHWNERSIVAGNSAVHPWQQKTVTISEIQPMEGEQSIQRGWVPPQPPSVAIPEAATAIWPPKTLAHKDHAADELTPDGNGRPDGRDAVVDASHGATKREEQVMDDTAE